MQKLFRFPKEGFITLENEKLSSISPITGKNETFELGETFYALVNDCIIIPIQINKLELSNIELDNVYYISTPSYVRNSIRQFFNSSIINSKVLGSFNSNLTNEKTDIIVNGKIVKTITSLHNGFFSPGLPYEISVIKHNSFLTNVSVEWEEWCEYEDDYLELEDEIITFNNIKFVSKTVQPLLNINFNYFTSVQFNYSKYNFINIEYKFEKENFFMLNYKNIMSENAHPDCCGLKLFSSHTATKKTLDYILSFNKEKLNLIKNCLFNGRGAYKHIILNSKQWEIYKNFYETLFNKDEIIKLSGFKNPNSGNDLIQFMIKSPSEKIFKNIFDIINENLELTGKALSTNK